MIILNRIQLRYLYEHLDKILINQTKEFSKMASAQETLQREVAETKTTVRKLLGAVTDLTKLTKDFSQYVKDNIGNDAALLAAAADLDADQAEVDAAVQEVLTTISDNPLPTPPPVEPPVEPPVV
jgi:DNA-binding transcriptional regulator GbsR (MarR family)